MAMVYKIGTTTKADRKIIPGKKNFIGIENLVR